MKYTAYVSRDCPKCQEFVNCVLHSSQAKQDFVFVELQTLPPELRVAWDSVRQCGMTPPVIARDGRVLCGSQVLDLLETYQTHVLTEPESLDVTCGDLLYS